MPLGEDKLGARARILNTKVPPPPCLVPTPPPPLAISPLGGRTVRCARAVPVLCARCAKSRLFSTTGSHRSQGPEFCTLHPPPAGTSGISFFIQSDACHGSQGPEFCTPDAVLNGSYILL